MTKWMMSTGVAALALAASVIGAAAEPLKAAWVYVGPVGDFGYSYQHDAGRKAAQAALGDKVQTTFVENVAEGPDAERVIEQLARAGNKIVFTTSFGFMEPTLKVARRNPKTEFANATGYKRDKNVGTYSSRFYEGRYVVGQIAARMSKTGIVGYVGSFPIPEVISGINAFMLGAQSVRPDMKVKIVWVNSWYDPGKEADAAKAMIDQGADIISQHTDSPAPLQTAEQRGVHGFGQSSDMIKFAPKAQLTSIVDDWSGYYAAELKKAIDGTWTSGDTWGGLDSGMVVMAPYTNMPDEVAAMAKATEVAIREHRLHPFQGPVRKQDGTLAVKEGATLPDGEILGMNWYVKGIDDAVPQ